MAAPVLVLSYSKCSTCKKALKWLADRGVLVEVRPIVAEPPTRDELDRWIEQSGVGVRKWLNTSGESYRALGKSKIDAASDEQIAAWLAADGKLVKRPVLIAGLHRTEHGDTVLVGFRPEAYEAAFANW